MIIHQTQRLYLGAWELGDFEDFAPIARNPDVMRYIAEGEVWADSRIGWFLGMQSAYQETLGYCQWKLIDRASSALIGFCGLSPLSSIGETEIGWWLDPNYWHQGLAREAAEKVVDAAFQIHGLNRIVARAYRANSPSIKLIDRLHMRFDRILGEGPAGEILLYEKTCCEKNY